MAWILHRPHGATMPAEQPLPIMPLAIPLLKAPFDGWPKGTTRKERELESPVCASGSKQGE